MKRVSQRSGLSNNLYVLGAGSVAVMALLIFMLFRGTQKPGISRLPHVAGQPAANELFVYCAAGMRYPMEAIAEQYKREYGVSVQLQYGGTNTLLSQLEVSQVGDLFLAAEDSYVDLAEQKGLTAERLPLAEMRPVIAVQKGNPKKIRAIADLTRDDVKVCMGNPDAAAIGDKVRELLKATGQWDSLEQHVTNSGVFKPTVNEVANDVKLGSVDAGIIWDSTAAQYPELEAIHTPELEPGLALIEIAVLNSSKHPTQALQFARYVAARDKGLKVFEQKSFQPVDGDLWAERPQLTFFAGAVNRRALEPIIKQFEDREGVTVNTIYNGCGILTAQMRTMQQNQDSGFPDTYMACDVYYLETVQELFQDAVNVSDTDIVIVVQKGNPKNITSLSDLVRPGVRVAIGQPEQCTIGALTRRLLQQEGIYDKLLTENVVTQTATSALLVPAITTGSADAVLAYATDTRSESDKLEAITIDSPLAKAVQPYSIARSSNHKYLGRRLFATISKSRNSFEAAGFHWLLADGEATK